MTFNQLVSKFKSTLKEESKKYNMTINQLVSEIESTIKEESKKYNNGEISYSYVTGFLLGTLKGVASSLNPRKALEEELENLKRKP